MKKIFSILIFTIFLASISAFGQGFSNIAAEFGIDEEYNTIEYGGGVSFVDFNQDGLDDLSFATEKDKKVLFFLNTGDGFEQLPNLIDDISEVKQILWVDYNDDSLLDLFITGESNNKLYKNLGNLLFTDVTENAGFDFPTLTTYASTWFDYNSDGRLDLAVSHRTTDEEGWIDLYRNIDNELFIKETNTAGLIGKGTSVLAMTILDYNNDGLQDLFLAQDWDEGNQLLENNGNGTFKDVSKISGIDYKMNSMTATIVDINTDGWQDLYVTNTTEGNILLVNDQNGHFEELSEEYGLDIRNVTFGTVFFDADNDGDDDAHIGGMQTNYSFEKTEDNVFVRRNNEWGMITDNEFNNGVAIGDFNDDGYPDIAKNSVSRNDIFFSKHSLWKNEFSENNFISINLEGTISNKFGIGSRVYIHTEGQIQMKRVACGESFSSQHSLKQNFGIGKNTLIDSIVVHWPSGNKSSTSLIPVNQTITILEPAIGCMDEFACNYSPEAIESNNTCRYPNEFYDCFGCINDSDNDGICDELEIDGCNDIEACNYDDQATDNNGSCIYLSQAEITGEQNAEILQKYEYTYQGSTSSTYNWTIDNGSIIFGNGSTTITTLWYEEEMGTLTVQEISESGCLGMPVTLSVNLLPAENNTILPLSITPNPVNSNLFIEGIPESITHLALYNSAGMNIWYKEINESFFVTNLESLPSGLFILHFIGEEKFIQKFFKD